MGGRAGGGASAGMGSGSRGNGGYSSRRAKELADKYLTDFKNPELKKALAEGLAEFDKEFGIPSKITVTPKALESNVYGQIWTHSGRIEINTKYETGGFDIKHAKHTMIHELAHSIDGSLVKDVSYKNGRIVKTVKEAFKSDYNQLGKAFKTFKSGYWHGETSAKQIGSYALTDRHEFFADAVASHMTGTKNSHTTFAFNLAKKMTGKL